MREYSKVSPKLWRSRRFRGLGTDDARLLYLFLLTCEHQNSAGGFRLPAAYAAADLNWPEERLQTGMETLAAADLIVRDEETEEVFIRRWFNHNPGTNPKHRKGIERLICEIDSDEVREAAEAEFQESENRRNPLDDVTADPGHRLTGSRYMGGGMR